MASPIALRSVTARNDLPISREISLARPPETWSRRTRSGDDPGSIAYSAVIQPLPDSRIQRGTSDWTDAVHRTFVLPIEIKTEPGVDDVKGISSLTSLS
jgi:hypothetical protein